MLSGNYPQDILRSGGAAVEQETAGVFQKAVEEFEADYRKYYAADESKSMDVGMPVLIKGKSRKIGVLLCHGYMAAPLEVKQLALYLGSLGFWVYIPRLKGHGTSPEAASP